MGRLAYSIVVGFAALALAAMAACQSDYEKESPYGRSKWSGAIGAIGSRIRDQKPVPLGLLREKFGPESLTRKVNDDRRRVFWYLPHGDERLTTLLIADVDDVFEQVVAARLIESRPMVPPYKLRFAGESCAARIESGESLTLTTMRRALGVEREGRFNADGTMQLSWYLSPGYLVGVTDADGRYLVSASVAEHGPDPVQ